MGLAELRKLREENAKLENTTVTGARVLTPKQQLLDASDVEKMHPDMNLRWLNLRNPEKVLSRQQDGYVKVAPSEGGRQLGDEMALFGIPKEVAEERKKRQLATAASRLKQHENDAAEMADNIARELRDRHGIKVDPAALFSPGVGA